MTISVRKGEKLQQVNEARDFCSTATAKREFADETGYRPRGKSLPLGAAKQLRQSDLLVSTTIPGLLRQNGPPGRPSKTSISPAVRREAPFADQNLLREPTILTQIIFSHAILPQRWKKN
jgi:hypothetical protein